MMQHNHENFLRGGGVSKECSDVSTTMNVFTSLPNFMSCALLVFLKNAGVRQKKGFYVKMSSICMDSVVSACIKDIFFLKSLLPFWFIALEGVKD